MNLRLKMISRNCLNIVNSSKSLPIKYALGRIEYSTCLCLCKYRRNSNRPNLSLKLRTTYSSPVLELKSRIHTELKNNVKNTLPSEELLEKLIAGLSMDIHQKNRVYKSDVLRVITRIKEMNFSTKKQGLLLIHCCTELLPDEPATSRMELLDHVWNVLKSHTKFEVEHYNELLRVYVANARTVTAHKFIQEMSPVKPNITTYELILRSLAETGDLNQATEVIANMKSQNVPATEDIFNSLIICQGKAGNPQNVQEILTMMKSLNLQLSVDTYTAVARAYAFNKMSNQLLKELEKIEQAGIQFSEYHIMEIVKTLCVVGLHNIIPQVLRYLPEETLKSPSISPYMQSVTTLLVFQNSPMAALDVYKCLPLPSFGPKDDKGLHGRSLIRDCVKASVPSSLIGLITQDLMASGRNPIALQNATEAALQLGKVPLALDLLTRMKQLGLPLRPHYFWPVLLHSTKSSGEKGIMNTLSTMVTMDVKPDYETIMDYVLPYVSFTSPQNLMKKFREAGLTISTVLTPMMETLLNSGQVRAASEICELFEGKVDTDKILKPLLKGFLLSMDVKSLIHLLEDVTSKAADNKKDWVGRFLCVFMQHKKTKGDLSDFMNVVKALKDTSLRISTMAADYCLTKLPEKYKEEQKKAFNEALISITDERLMDDGDIFTQQIPHPKNMNEQSLKAHLIELEAKGMNTRGVLRKLLQQYCREGNLAAAQEIVEKCTKEGVFLSAGMKAAIFDLHVKLGEIELAELVLADLNKTSPNFALDEYKIIDFATLMVYRNEIQRAYQLINEQSKRRHIQGGRGIALNCWRLLDAVAAQGTPDDVQRMFELLTSLGYCRPSNTLLGPMVRVHLRQGNLEEAVKEFERLSRKYNRTPLKHELLCHIMMGIGEGQSEDKFVVNEKTNGRLNKMAQAVLNVDKKVHGPGDVQLTLIAALAEVGYKNSLRKLFLDPTVKFHPDALLRRCERFADDKKLAALETIAVCAKGLRHIEVGEIYEMMLDVCQVDNNVKEALALWTRMQESDVNVSQKFVRDLCSLLKYNKKDVPPELSVLIDKANKATN